MSKASYQRRLTAQNELEKLRDERRRLDKQINAVVRRAFPIGSTFAYRHGNHTRIATVVEHNRHNASLRVEGVTGSRYWIDVWRTFG